MQTTFTLTPQNNSLIGKYVSDAEHVLIVCDSSLAPFDVRIPDVKMWYGKELMIKNIPSSGDGNNVTVYSNSNQFIDNEPLHVVAPYDFIALRSDNKDKSILLDANSIFNIVSHHDLGDLTTYDDHTQYLYLPGRIAGHQDIVGDINISGNLGLGTSVHDERLSIEGGIQFKTDVDDILSKLTNSIDSFGNYTSISSVKDTVYNTEIKIRGDETVNHWPTLEVTSPGNSFRAYINVYGSTTAIGNAETSIDLSKSLQITKDGDVGIGVTPTTDLDINGTVKIRGGSPSAGYVLSCDANGLASWINPTGFATTDHHALTNLTSYDDHTQYLYLAGRIAGYQSLTGGLNVSGYLGINTVAPSTNLDVDGTVRIRGGSPSANYVLKCDANGLASWSDPATLIVPSHHSLTNLTNYDDHSQYLYLAGRGGVQTILDNLGLYHTTANTYFDVESGSGYSWMGAKVAINKYGWLYLGDNATYGWQIIKDTSDNFYINSLSTTSEYNGTRLYLNKLGNLGIGTNTPNKIGSGSNSKTITLNGYDTAVFEFCANESLLGRFQAQSGSMNFVYDGVGYVSFWTQNIERMRIASNGDTGIGTQSPEITLHVQSGAILQKSTSYARLMALTTGVNSATLNLAYGASYTNPGTNWGIGYDVTTGNLNFVYRSDNVKAEGNDTTYSKVSITTAGYVGIGTTSPTYSFENAVGYASKFHGYTHIFGNIGSFVGVGGTIPGNSTTIGSCIFGWNASAGGGETNFINAKGAGSYGGFTWDFWNGTTRTIKMAMDTNGHVCIGASSPTEKLHLYGSVNGGGVNLKIQNAYQASSSTDETAGIIFSHQADSAGKIISGKDGDYSDGAHSNSNLAFYTSYHNTDTLRLKMDASGTNTFTSNNLLGEYIFTVDGDEIYGSYIQGVSSSFDVGNFHSVTSNTTHNPNEETVYWWGAGWEQCVVNMDEYLSVRTFEGFRVFTSGTAADYIGTRYNVGLPNLLALDINNDNQMWVYRDLYLRNATLTQQAQFTFGTNYFGITSTKDSGYTQEIRYEYANVSAWGTQILEIGSWSNSFQGYLYVQGNITAIGNAEGSPTTDGTKTININSVGKTAIGSTPYTGLSTYEPTLYVNGTTRTDAMIIKLTAGETISRGMLVYVKDSGGTDGRVYKNPISGITSVGVAYDDATTGNDILVVISGICHVLPDSTLTATRGYTILPSSTTAGYARESTGVSSGMIGFWLDTGSGNGAITRAVLKVQ